MEFYVGQKVKSKETGAIGEIVSRYMVTHANKLWTVNMGETAVINFCLHESQIEPIEDPKPEYKIGDRFLHKDEEVEIVGYYMHGADIVFVRRKDNTVFAPSKSELKVIPQPLKEGRVVWVKSEIIKHSVSQGVYVVKYPYEAGNWICEEGEIYIKNAEGKIIPYAEK